MTKEELKKEAEEKYNERLKQNGIKVEYRNETYTDGYLDGAEPREKRIAELEKENAKLRKDKKELCHSISEGGKACVYLNDQLTKAKELLKQWLQTYKASGCDNINIVTDTEQFLNSEGK